MQNRYSEFPEAKFVPIALGDWIFTYNEDMNTWLVQKSIMSWTVHVRTKAVIPDNNYCR